MKKFYKRLKKDGVIFWMWGGWVFMGTVAMTVTLFGPITLTLDQQDRLYKNDHNGMLQWIFIFVASSAGAFVAGGSAFACPIPSTTRTPIRSTAAP